MNAVLSHSKDSNRSIVGLALSLSIPSLAILQKYFHIVGVIAYIAIVFIALYLLTKYRYLIAKLASKASTRQIYGLAAITFLILLITFFLIYPKAGSRTYGHGSDCDDAINIATTRLLHGQYPYYFRTYLGNAVSPLPGSLILAIPFVLLGNSAYQNIFWLLMFFIAMKFYLEDERSALLLLWIILALSPVVLHQIVTGIDYLSNSLFIMLFIMWLVKSTARTEPGNWKIIIPAILLGIGFSTRANFLLLLPLIFFALTKTAGWQKAILYTGIICFTFALVTFPFYLYDPKSFSPLLTKYQLKQFESIIPYIDLIIPLITGIIALLLALFQPVH